MLLLLDATSDMFKNRLDAHWKDMGDRLKLRLHQLIILQVQVQVGYKCTELPL